jgi:hypothetical protein
MELMVHIQLLVIILLTDVGKFETVNMCYLLIQKLSVTFLLNEGVIDTRGLDNDFGKIENNKKVI